MLYIATNLENLKTSSYQRQINNTRKDLRLRESLKKMLIEYKMDIQKIKFKLFEEYQQGKNDICDMLNI